MKLWDVATGQRIVSLGDATGEIYAVGFGVSGDVVYGAGVDRSIRVWELKGQGGSPLKSVFAHDAPVLRMAIARDGKTLVTSGEDRAVKTWDLPDLKPRANLGAQSDWPQALAIGHDGTRVAVGRYDGSLAILDAASGKNLMALREEPKPGSPPRAPAEIEVGESEPNDDPAARPCGRPRYPPPWPASSIDPATPTPGGSRPGPVNRWSSRP